MTLALQSQSNAAGLLSLEDVGAELHPAALPKADEFFDVLRAELPWAQRDIRMFGRRIPEPRLSAWNSDLSYTYSGLTLPPAPWHPAIKEIRDYCQRLTGNPFNSALANFYRSGQDSMGWHSDDERELGPKPIIASVSLGERRRFQFRLKEDKKKRVDLELGHGDVLIMTGRCQVDWQHQLPKTGRRKDIGPRINLTFRRIVLQAP